MDRKHAAGLLIENGIDSMIWWVERRIKKSYDNGYKDGSNSEEYKKGYNDGYSKGYDRGC